MVHKSLVVFFGICFTWWYRVSAETCCKQILIHKTNSFCDWRFLYIIGSRYWDQPFPKGPPWWVLPFLYPNWRQRQIQHPKPCGIFIAREKGRCQTFRFHRFERFNILLFNRLWKKIVRCVEYVSFEIELLHLIAFIIQMTLSLR